MENGKILTEQINKLYENIKYSLSTIIFLAFLECIVLYFIEKDIKIVYWFIAFLFISLMRCLDYFSFLKKKDYKKHYKIFLILVTVSAFIFSGIYLIIEPKYEISKYFMIFITAGISAGAISTLFYSKRAIVLFEIFLILPPVWYFFSHGEILYKIMAFILILYLIIILKLAIKANSQYVSIIKLNKKLYNKSNELSIQNQYFRHICEDIPIGIFFYNKNLTIIKCNNFFAEKLNIPKNKLIGFNLKNIKEEKILKTLKKVFNKEKGYYKGEYNVFKKKYFIELFTSYVELENKIIEGVGVVVDLTDLKTYEEKIRKLAFYDELTGLPKRTLLLEGIEHAIKKAKRNVYSTLVYLDIDNFKDINDSLGHNIGDFFLKEIAKRLKNCIREIDIVSRLGGDEFAVLLVDLSDNKEKALKKSMEIAHRIINEIQKPLIIEGMEIRTSASIGIVLIDEKMKDIYSVIKYADAAMYSVKNFSKNGIKIYDVKLKEKIERAYKIKSELETAIKESQFVLHLQPQVDKNKNIIGAEALIRWNHPNKGIIYPNEFLDIAEEFNLMPKITQKVLEEAKKIINKLPEKIKIAVNISGKDIYDEDFIDILKIFSKKEGQYIELEITEQMLIKNIDKALENIKKIKSLYGMDFSIDDFGTGYSSLQYLKQLPVDNLKIDMSFVRDMLKDKNDYIIVQTIINMAKNLNLKTIAEGVESKEHFETLKKMGVDYFQGYYFAKPMDIDEFIKFLKTF